MLAANTYFSFFSLDLFSCSCFHQEQWKDAHTTTGCPNPQQRQGFVVTAVGLQPDCSVLPYSSSTKPGQIALEDKLSPFATCRCPKKLLKTPLSGKNANPTRGKGGGLLTHSTTLKTQNERCADENDVAVLKNTFPPPCQEEARKGECSAPHFAAHCSAREQHAAMALQESVKLLTLIYFSGSCCEITAVQPHSALRSVSPAPEGEARSSAPWDSTSSWALLDGHRDNGLFVTHILPLFWLPPVPLFGLTHQLSAGFTAE